MRKTPERVTFSSSHVIIFSVYRGGGAQGSVVESKFGNANPSPWHEYELVVDVMLLLQDRRIDCIIMRDNGMGWSPL